MNMMRSIWASVQGNPIFMMRFNGWGCLLLIAWTFFCLTVPIGKQLAASVSYVTFISHIALVLGFLGAWQASRVEVVQEQERQKREAEPVEEKVVERIVKETEIDRSS